MARWLFKQEPSCYGFDDLERDGETLWDGVGNPLAQKHLRAVEDGDEVFFYHTGDEKAVVGVMTAVGAPELAPGEEKKVAVRVKFLRRLANPVSLAAIKADPAFAEWELVKQSRLSVMPVSATVWKLIEKMAKSAAETPGEKPAKKTKKPAG